MQIDFLLIGQGICGTFLDWYLQKAGYLCVVIDQHNPCSASQVAAGIINPVTGRRIVKTWKIDEVLPFAWSAYSMLGDELNLPCIEEKNIIEFFPTPQIKLAFENRLDENGEYLSPGKSNDWSQYFNFDFDYGEISPCYLVNLQQILPTYRKHLAAQSRLLEEKFEIANLQVNKDHIVYKDIRATHIIFCDGIASFENPYFKNLPFAPNKGEILWIEAPGVPVSHIFKKGMSLVTWSEHIFWIGSSYEWEFEHANPTELFKERTVAYLKQWLKRDFKVIDHKASIRPATLERRPFIGFHPTHSSVGIFNGMGTKGCSLAPFFARQVVEHIRIGTPIDAEADVQRFRLLLKKSF